MTPHGISNTIDVPHLLEAIELTKKCNAITEDSGRVAVSVYGVENGYIYRVADGDGPIYASGNIVMLCGWLSEHAAWLERKAEEERVEVHEV